MYISAAEIYISAREMYISRREIKIISYVSRFWKQGEAVSWPFPAVLFLWCWGGGDTALISNSRNIRYRALSLEMSDEPNNSSFCKRKKRELLFVLFLLFIFASDKSYMFNF